MQKPFREDCIAMRLSCKTFSSLRTLLAALSYDYVVFTTREGIVNLEALSRHPVIRTHVHRLVFCPPSLHAREQEALGDGALIARCGQCVSRFPKLWSVFISNSVPHALNLDTPPKEYDISSLARNHWQQSTGGFCATPAEQQEEQDEIRAANNHTAFVLRTLAAANARLQELVTYDDWGPTWEFSWDSAPACLGVLDFSGLTRVDFCLRDGNEAPGGADWSAVLCPLLAQSPALTELYLRFAVRHNRYPTVSGIWELNFPGLAVLSIEELGVARTTFGSFLGRHTKLQELTIESAKEVDGIWYSIFQSIRDNPALDDLDIWHLDEWKLGCRIRTKRQPVLSDDVTLELYDYLHGEGDWTASLSWLWGDS